jgi:hypothetical protein
LKMTVNERDGVIDVEFPGFSPVNSPPTTTAAGSAYHPGSSPGSFGLLHSLVSNLHRDTGHANNVAGWLRIGIHPDFSLQATPPYAELLEDVKNAMCCEPTPITRRAVPDGEAKEEWVDVCTSVIADTTTFTIKRLKLRRLVRYLPPPPPPAITPMTLPRPGQGVKGKLMVRSQYGNPYDETLHAVPTHTTVAEEFSETSSPAPDLAFTDALERVLATPSPSGPSSRATSVRHGTGLERGREEEVPTSECEGMVIGALEQIATAVERERRDVRRYGGARLRGLGPGGGEEGVLREEIREWFERVERGRVGERKGRRSDAAVA